MASSQIIPVSELLSTRHFTGLRLGEYLQSHVTKADGINGFDPVPTSIHLSKEWRSVPTAFIRDNFVVLPLATGALTTTSRSATVIDAFVSGFGFVPSPWLRSWTTWVAAGQLAVII
jgi:hypothetical protein